MCSSTDCMVRFIGEQSIRTPLVIVGCRRVIHKCLGVAADECAVPIYFDVADVTIHEADYVFCVVTWDAARGLMP